ncbi:hypothetical protein C0J52_06477 [Blattella germanica]|nr:hypothetical protein C0J52_06477 [Blattella germanica]
MAAARLTFQQRKCILKWFIKFDNACEVQRQWRREFETEPPDGTTAHYHLTVRAFLDNNLRGYWIERRGSIELPDHTPMGFYLWETAKDQVYRRKPRTLEGPRQEITAARTSHMQRSPLKQ